MTRQEAINVMEKYTYTNVGISDVVIKAHQMAIDALENQRWIPVTERLPDRYETVLVTAKMEIDTEPLVYEGALGIGWELCGVENSKDYKVDAWMPLPKPYKLQILQYADNDTAQPGLMPAT